MSETTERSGTNAPASRDLRSAQKGSGITLGGGPADAGSNAAPVGRGRAKAVKVVPPTLVKWRGDVLVELHWKEKREDHRALQARLATDLGGMDAAAFTFATPPKVPAGKRGKAPTWNKFVDILDAVQGMPQRRGGASKQMLAELIQRADNMLAELDGDESPDARQKRDACHDARSDAHKYELWDGFVELGMPDGWGGQEAMKAAGIKASLDLETLPAAMAERVGGDGINPAFWIKRDGNGQQPDTTAIFKPLSNRPAVGGIPAGGEVAREALTSRTSDLLGFMTGLDFGVPDTHVVSISASKIPAGRRAREAPIVTGSLQSFAATDGEMRDQSYGITERIPPETCQKMAILDTITLNLDRHAGNFMVNNNAGGAPDLVPIDHGLSFPSASGLDEMAGNMAAEKNALLRMPGSWKKFSDENLAAIAQINPDALKQGLKIEADNLAAVHGDAGATIDAEALEVSARAAKFLKRAAPELSPALVQIAMGTRAEWLLDPQLDTEAFNAEADACIAKVKGSAAALEAYFVDMTDEERQAMKTRLKRNGWARHGNGQFDEQWMFANLELALRLYREDRLNTELLKEITALGADAAQIKAVLDSGRGLYEAYSRAQSAAPAARPGWTATQPNAKKQAALKAATDAFGQLKGDEAQALARAEEFEQLGGASALKAAIAVLAPSRKRESEIQNDIEDALYAMKQAARLKAAPTDRPKVPPAVAQASKLLEHVQALAALLDPATAQPFVKRINDLQFRLNRNNLSGEFLDTAEIRSLRADVSDAARALLLARCTDYRTGATALGLPANEIDRAIKPAEESIKQGLLLVAARSLPRPPVAI